MVCRLCGSEIPDGVKFCPECGKPTSEVTDDESAVETVAQVAVEAVEEAASEAVSEAKIVCCPRCGSPIPEGKSFCPKCGSAAEASSSSLTVYSGTVEPQNVNDGLATILGILSVIIGSLGAFLFGNYGAIIGLTLGIIALVMSIDIKKKTNNAKGGAGFSLGIIGTSISALLFISCMLCGACTCGTGCYGCVGGACKTGCNAYKAEKVIENFSDILDDYS